MSYDFCDDCMPHLEAKPEGDVLDSLETAARCKSLIRYETHLPFFSEGCTLFVNNIPDNTTKTEIMDLFNKIAAIRRTAIAIDPQTRLVKVFLLIEYDSEAEAMATKLEFDGFEFKGNQLSVSFTD